MINNVILCGRLTAAPELKTTANGQSVTTFSLAVERRFQPKGGEKVTDFITCVAWRNTAEFICRYFKKGEPITVAGEIQTRKYQKDGDTRTAVEVVVDYARFVPTNNNANNAPANNDFTEVDEIDDDLPF